MVMVIWIVIRYIIIVGTSRSKISIFTKAIIVIIIAIIRIIIWGIIMMIWITITFIIMVRNSRIAIRTYIEVGIIIIIKK